MQGTHVKMHICGKPGLQRALTRATDSLAVWFLQPRERIWVGSKELPLAKHLDFTYLCVCIYFKGKNSCLELITKVWWSKFPLRSPTAIRILWSHCSFALLQLCPLAILTQALMRCYQALRLHSRSHTSSQLRIGLLYQFVLLTVGQGLQLV